MYLFLCMAVFLPAIVLVSSRPRDTEGQPHRASACFWFTNGTEICTDPVITTHSDGTTSGSGKEDALTRLLRQMDEAENVDGENDEAASQMDGEVDESTNEEADEEANEEAKEMDEEANEEANVEANEEANEMEEEANEMDEEAAEMDEEANKKEEEAKNMDQD